ncbi:MAG TPA: ornithine cyclodeaminase family protein [Terriglobia bacterium]|nr:ornithine cyclodeaminase family protein [Terriglobia bacterium]
MLFLTENDVQDLFPMSRAIDCVTASLKAQHDGSALNRSRERVFLPDTSLHYMAAGYAHEKLLGMKIYTVSRDALRFLVLLYDGESGALLALLEGDHLGRIRTGAASGVATAYMARPDAARAGVIGTGRQARTQLEAVAAVRPIRGARVFGRDRERREAFAKEMTAKFGFEVIAVESAEGAVREAEVVITATTSRDPVLKGDWIEPGAHLNAIGANMLNRRELDDTSLARAALIAVDTVEQAKEEAGDLVQGLGAIRGGWSSVIELHEIVAGTRPGRNSASDITIFKSSGIALWDVISAGSIYQQALAADKGRRIPLWDDL